MIVNPYKDRDQLTCHPGTRVLQQDFGLAQWQLPDLYRPGRIWTITRVLAPIKERHLGGIRVKLVDQKGFVTFCNQRDLEVLLGLAVPGSSCRWGYGDYKEPNTRDWIGFAADFEDLRDDLQEVELSLRQQYPYFTLPDSLQIVRLLHLSERSDHRELDMVLSDVNRTTGETPDVQFSTIMERWTRIEREVVLWDDV